MSAINPANPNSFTDAQLLIGAHVKCIFFMKTLEERFNEREKVRKAEEAVRTERNNREATAAHELAVSASDFFAKRGLRIQCLSSGAEATLTKSSDEQMKIIVESVGNGTPDVFDIAADNISPGKVPEDKALDMILDLANR